MSTRQRYATRGNNKSQTPYGWILFVLTMIWLAIAAFAQKSPIHVITDVYHSTIGDSLKVTKTNATWIGIATKKNSAIDSLAVLLDKCENASPYLSGSIEINDDFVNMRSEANLSSSILTKVPNGAKVDVLYFDTKELFWDGKMGKWGKVKYADLEGWIWGNYIKIQE